MDNYHEFTQDGQDKHQRFMQLARKQRQQKQVESAAAQQHRATLRLRPALTTLINLVTK